MRPAPVSGQGIPTTPVAPKHSTPGSRGMEESGTKELEEEGGVEDKHGVTVHVVDASVQSMPSPAVPPKDTTAWHKSKTQMLSTGAKRAKRVGGNLLARLTRPTESSIARAKATRIPKEGRA